MQPDPERELVDRCRRGDDGAFPELVDEYKHLVFALIARTVPNQSHTENLAQEVFLRVHRGLPYFRGQARLATWIYRIVLNVCTQRPGRTDGEPPNAAPAAPPPDFTQHVVAAVRRDRWRREQVLDLGFNLTILLVGIAITAGALLMVFQTGIASVVLDLADAGIAELMRRAEPLLPVYGSAAALVGGALAVWWWAEKDVFYR